MTQKFVFLLVCIHCLSCNQRKADPRSEEEKLMQVSREWSKSASTDSIEKTLGFWADDAIVMPPGQQTLKGKNAIHDMIKGTAKIPGFHISWEPLSVEISKSGDLAYMIEQNKITVNDSTGKPVTEYNKGVTVWKKQPDGSWKNIVDIWNANPSK